jgi:hypothetical protein
MEFLLAGEGPSDLGALNPDGSIKKGPMACVIDALCRQNSLPIPTYAGWMNHNQLSKLAAAFSRGGPERPVRKDGAKFYDQAAALAHEAKKQDICGAIYFQDCDRTSREPSAKTWETLHNAVTLGFQKENFTEGVPMIPNPRSEVWFLAYYQKHESEQQAYNHAERFEDMSGNDSSPKSVKKTLAKLLKCGVDEIYDHITEPTIHTIDWSKVDMPSFNRFKKNFLVVARRLISISNSTQ